MRTRPSVNQGLRRQLPPDSQVTFVTPEAVFGADQFGNFRRLVPVGAENVIRPVDAENLIQGSDLGVRSVLASTNTWEIAVDSVGNGPGRVLRTPSVERLCR